MGNLNEFKSILNAFWEFFKNECFEKIFKFQIFTNKTIDSNILNNSNSLSQLNEANRRLVIESLEEISIYNADFSQLKQKYLLEFSPNVNLKNFKTYIKKYNYRIYYIKAIFSFIIRLLLTIAQFLNIILLTYPKYICQFKQIDNTDRLFWVYNQQQYKVITVNKDKEFFLRILNFVAELFFFILEGFVLLHLQRIILKKYYVLILQILRLYSNCWIIYLDFSKQDCENSQYDENMFYIKKNNVLEKINIFYDIIKFLIN